MSMSESPANSILVDIDSGAKEPKSVTIGEDLRLLEALLFASSSAVTERVIRERLGEDVDIAALLEQLKALYEGRGIELARAGNRWFFRTAPDLGDRMKLEKIVPRKLSRAGIETLAIIAYHQPVTRAEIEEIRGVAFASGTLEILLELNWVRPSGRKNIPGKPIQYITTDEFLSHFNLQKLSDLPNIEELTSAGLIDSGNIDSSIFGTSKFFNDSDEKADTNKKKENIYSNIDDLLNRSLKSEEE